MKRILSQILTLAVFTTAISCEQLSLNEVPANEPVITSFTPQSAPIGAEIIVTGEYLHNVTAAYIGDVQVDITQKVSNVSKKSHEVTLCARLLAQQEKPIGIYFISEDIFTLASYYLEDMKDTFFMPTPDWQILPEDDDSRRMLHD